MKKIREEVKNLQQVVLDLKEELSTLRARSAQEKDLAQECARLRVELQLSRLRKPQDEPWPPVIVTYTGDTKVVS